MREKFGVHDYKMQFFKHLYVLVLTFRLCLYIIILIWQLRVAPSLPKICAEVGTFQPPPPPQQPKEYKHR